MIMIVDDSVDNLRVLSTTLTKAGHTVRCVKSGPMALVAVQANPPVLILLDVMMAEMDGYEVCRQLKANAKTQDIPVIFLSALDDALDKVKAFEVGAVDYITKPFQVEEVQARVHHQLTIRNLQDQLMQQNQQLQQEIQERQQVEISLQQKNTELGHALQQLQQTQHELVESAKMAVLGQLVASIAHEINTPLGAIQASISNIMGALNASLKELPNLLTQLSLEQREIFLLLLQTAVDCPHTLSFREERQLRVSLMESLTQQAIASTDRLADILSKMGMNQDITPFLPLLQLPNNVFILETAYSLVMLKTNSQNIQLAVDRAAKIVFALKSYAYHDSSKNMVLASVPDSIDIVLTLYHNLLKQGVEVEKSYAETPAIYCYPEELNQIWVNLIQNAIQAMQQRGRLHIAVAPEDEGVVVAVTDSGPGIPPEIQSQIFKPFFTTKPISEGSGLGLDIVSKIVDRHQGRIEVASQPGQTTFRVWLPIVPKQP